MSRYVADTHALIWPLYSDPKLSPMAQRLFARADAGDETILVPTIVLVEIIYLAEKKRIPTDAVQRALAPLSAGADNYQIAPLDMQVVEALPRISREAVPELPDRLIAATALSLGVPLISRDLSLARLSQISVIW